MARHSNQIHVLEVPTNRGGTQDVDRNWVFDIGFGVRRDLQPPDPRNAQNIGAPPALRGGQHIRNFPKTYMLVGLTARETRMPRLYGSLPTINTNKDRTLSPTHFNPVPYQRPYPFRYTKSY